MAVQLPLHIQNGRSMTDLHEALAQHYEGAQFVKILPMDESHARIVPTDLNGTNMMHISVQGNRDAGCATVVAVLDNLGKGASGASVQNLNIMLGLDEATGL